MAEGQWRGPGPVCTELVGFVEDGGVTVGGGQYDKGGFAGVDGDLAKDVIVRGGARHGLRGAVEAQQFGDQLIVDP
jgi:hypothetical protein